MSERCGDKLPPELMERLNRGDLYRTGGLGLTILTVDDSGWPHVSMAPGAVAARPDEVLFAVGAASRSRQNLERDGKVTLLVAGPAVLYYVKGQGKVVRPEMTVMAQEAAVRLTVTEVLKDMESFLTITGGVSYRYNLMHDDFVTVIGALLDELVLLAEAN